MQKAKLVVMTQTVMTQPEANGYGHGISQSKVTGSYDPASSNQVANYLDDHWPTQTQDAILAALADAPEAGMPSLLQDDVSPASSAMVIEADKNSEKYSCDNVDHVESSDDDAGASNLASADHAPEKENAAKLTSTSRTEPSSFDGSDNTAQS